MSAGNSSPVVVAITGASGVLYGCRLIEVLMRSGIEVHLTISDSGRLVLQHELDIEIDLDNFELGQLVPSAGSDHKIRYHHYKDFMTPIASGSFRTRAMVICPCSGSTLSGIASAAGRNLIERAADVHLKERRPLILVPRETPLSLIQIENMQTVSRAGGTIMPASPGFYHGYKSVDD
ncbi:MAG: UbiX family flavin prenyltransferase, partial [Planctomycetota bacterium]